MEPSLNPLKSHAKNEKRSEKRLKKNLLVYNDHGTFDLLGVSENISKSGMFIESPYSLPVDSEVILALAADSDLYRIKGMICWVKRPGDRFPLNTSSGMGVRITEAPGDYINYVEYTRYEGSVGVEPMHAPGNAIHNE